MPELKVRITAVDNATKVVNNINKSISQVFRPYDNAKRSIKSFSDALGRNDFIARSMLALRSVGGGVANLGNAFGVAENSILASSGRMAGAIGSIGGPIGGLVAAGVAAAGATTAVAVKMGEVGQNVKRTAAGIGITTDELQTYRSVAKQSGLETESMDQALQGFSARLTDVAAGRAPDLANVLAAMHIELKKNADGTVDVTQAWRDYMKFVAKMDDPQQQRIAAETAGLGSVLQLLRQGTEAYDRMAEHARRTGEILSPEQLNRLDKQADAWNQIKSNVDGAGKSIGTLIARYVDLQNIAARTSTVVEALTKTIDEKDNKSDKAGGKSLVDRVTGLMPFNVLSPFIKALPYAPSFVRNLAGSEAARTSSGKITDLSGKAQPPAGSATLGIRAQPLPGSAPRGIRNNNPGNLRSWAGAGSDGQFAVFPSPVAGLTAAGKNLLNYQDRGINTIAGIARRWAPGSDGNNVSAYIESLSKQTGFAPDQPLNLRDQNTLAPLLSAITKQENGQNPYSPEVIASAVAAALKDQVGAAGNGTAPTVNLNVYNVPAGLSVKVAAATPQNIGLAFTPGSAN